MTIKDTPQSLLEDIKKSLLSLYDFEEQYEISLLRYSENAIYKITFSTKEPVVFRIHRPDYHDYEELQGEMVWMDEILKDTDLILPKVYQGRNGELLQKMKTSAGVEVYVSVISFLYGKPIGELSGEELYENMTKLGEITAKLHLQSMQRDQSKGIKRFFWDIENLFGIDGKGIWGSWREYPYLSKEDYEILTQCEKKMIYRLECYGRSREHYGLIHGDLHFLNIINDGTVNQIIDFDDCGYGFYLYDLGCSLVTYSKNLKDLTECWRQGYEYIRKLTKEERGLLPMFVLLRRIVRLAWLSTHADSDTAKTVEPQYLKITIDMAKEYMESEAI